MPTKIIDSQTIQFRFNSESENKSEYIITSPVLLASRSDLFNFTCGDNNKPCYTITVNVNDIEYNGELYYEINYDIQFIPFKNCSPEQNARYKITTHPFATFSNDVKFESFIVHKNSLTQILTEFLLMNYTDLEKVSGSTTGERYKTIIMEILALYKITDAEELSTGALSVDSKTPYYTLDVTEKELKYECGYYYYDIGYEFKFISSDTCSLEENIKHEKLAHPFASFSSDDDTKFEGVIVYKNDLTKMLVEFLLMDYEELETKIQHTLKVSPQSYKSNVMESLALLWD